MDTEIRARVGDNEILSGKSVRFSGRRWSSIVCLHFLAKIIIEYDRGCTFEMADSKG